MEWVQTHQFERSTKRVGKLLSIRTIKWKMKYINYFLVADAFGLQNTHKQTQQRMQPGAQPEVLCRKPQVCRAGCWPVVICLPHPPIQMKNIQFPTLLHPLLSIVCYYCVAEAERGQAHIRKWHYWEENVSIKRVLGATHAAVAAAGARSLMPLLSSGDTRAFILSCHCRECVRKAFAGIREDVCFHVHAEVGGLPFCVYEGVKW